jgi:diguanylate cyclase (GGDEF)-like protein
MGTLAPAIEPADAALLDEVEGIVAAGTVDRPFSPAIQKRFLDATAEARFALFYRMAIGGIILYAMFTPIDALIIPDVLGLAAVLQLGIGVPISIGVLVAIRAYGARSHALASVVVVTMMTTTLILLLVTRSPHAGTVASAFAIIIVAGNVGIGLPFPWARGITGAALAAITLAILIHPTLDSATQVFSIVLNGSVAAFSLIGNYRIEASVRRSFLSALRESLRADQLAATNLQLQDLASLDGLTGVANRRRFDAALTHAWDTGEGRPLSLILVDIDYFKSFNDRFGHQAGDDCLRLVAATLSASARAPGLLLARYGGEEFALIAEATCAQEAMDVAERLRRDVAALRIDFGPEAQPVSMTVSIGCATVIAGPATDLFDLVAAADAALYAAKQGGRNRVCSGGAVALRELASSGPGSRSSRRSRAAVPAVSTRRTLPS